MNFPAVFETEPIGVGGAREAVAVFNFCSKVCRCLWVGQETDEWGENDPLIDGAVCDQCGKVLEEIS